MYHCPLQIDKYRFVSTFNKHCPSKAWRIILLVHYQSSNKVRLYHDMFCFKGLSSMFNDDICDETSDSLIYKESDFHCEGWENIIVSSLTLNIFPKEKNQDSHKVRHTYKMYLIKISLEIWTHAFILTWINFLPNVFWAFSILTRSNKSLPFAGKQIQACLHFQQSLSIEAWPHHIIGLGSKLHQVKPHHDWFYL